MASATASVNSLDVCQCLANMAPSSAAKVGAASARAAANIVSFFIEASGYNWYRKLASKSKPDEFYDTQRTRKTGRRQRSHFADHAARHGPKQCPEQVRWRAGRRRRQGGPDCVR